MRERKRIPRQHRRETYAGTLARASTVPTLIGEPLVLEIDRGARQRFTTKQGDVIRDELDTQRRLMCNIGDVLIVSASALSDNEVAAVEVTRVEQLAPYRERYSVRVVRGQIGNRKVWIQSAKGLAAKRAGRTA